MIRAGSFHGWIQCRSDGMRRSPAALTYEYSNQQANNGDDGAPLWNWCRREGFLGNADVFASGGFVVQRRDLGAVWQTVVTILSENIVGIACAACSLAICLASGCVRTKIIDGSFFKALGMLLGLLLSMRARSGAVRRERSLRILLGMGWRARDLIELVAPLPDTTDTPDDCVRERRKLRVCLEFTFAKIAHWVQVRELGPPEDGGSSVPTWQGPGVEDLPKEFRKRAMQLGSMPMLGNVSRPLVYFVREVCDSLWAPAEDPKIDRISMIRRWHKQIDIEIDGLLTDLDDMSTFLEEAQPRHLTILMKVLICAYTSLYPWLVLHENEVMLVATSLGVCFVFLSLHEIACELDDPLIRHSHGYNISLIFEQQFRNMECEEAVQVRCRHFLRNMDPADVCERTRRDFVAKELRTHGPFALGAQQHVLEVSSERSRAVSVRSL